jgi:uncharacterized protein involved in exopolysaccharide biosynthesis
MTNSPETRNETVEPIEPEPKPFPWAEVLSSVWLHRKWIAIFVIAATLISAGITFLLTPLYRAETSILPEISKEMGMAGMSMLREATGLTLGEIPVSKLYPMIVRSERILGAVLSHKYKTSASEEEVDLVEYWEISGDSENIRFEQVMKKLRERMTVNFDTRLGTVIIGVEMEEPQLAADVANRITTELDDYTRTKRRTNATLQREFIEERLKEVEGTLKKSEVALKDFREKNRRILDSPQLMLEQERLARDVQINSTVFVELKKQLEVVKIEEIKNIPIINVLDPARPPVQRSSPVRRQVALIAFFLSLAIGVSVAGFKDRGGEALKKLTLTMKNHPPVPGPAG